MDDGSPSLEVGFNINFGDSFGELRSLSDIIGDVQAEAVRQFQQIEAASRIDLSGATASIKSFGNAVSRQEQDLRRYRAEKTKFESSMEGTIKSLDRETAALGRTREERRALKIEEMAQRATSMQLRETAGRLLASEAANLERRGAVAEWEAQKRIQAEAAVNAQLMERSRIEAAIERTTGVGRVSAADAGATFGALDAQARELDLIQKQVAAEQMVTAEQRQQISILAERANLVAAIERTTGAGRIRATDEGAGFSALAAQAAEEEARALNLAAAAAQRAAREHAELAAMVRGSAAAQEADALAANRLRASIDPTFVATARLNDEMAESVRLYHAGVLGAEEYAHAMGVLGARLVGIGRSHHVAAVGASRNAFALTQLSFQINDIATMAAMGAAPMMILASQGGQIFQVFQMAEGGAKGFARQLGGLAVRFAPVIGAAAALGVGLFALNQNMQDPSIDDYVKTLGLTEEELKKLGDTSVTVGDMMSGLATTLGISFEGVGATIKGWIVDIGNFFGNVVKGIASATYGLFVGSYRAIIDTWRQFPAALGDLFIQGVNIAARAIEMLANASIDALNGLAAGANGLLGVDLFGSIDRVQIARLKNDFAGAAQEVGTTWTSQLESSTREALDAIDGIMNRWTANSQQAARDRLAEGAAEIRAARTGKGAGQNGADRDVAGDAARAIEAQIVGLYRLADAYGVSGAAAMIAEAQVKAEAAALRERGDLGAMVERQIRLAVAERVSEAAKSTAAMRDQIAVQTEINTAVAAGIIPAQQAADMMRERIADLPLLAALEAARIAGDVRGADAATEALERQRAAQVALTAAQNRAKLDGAMAGGADQLEMLREELRLVGATEAVRLRELAIAKAAQEARANGWTGDAGAAYIQQQVEIAEAQQAQRDATADYNQALSFTADLFDTLDQAAVNAGRGMADAFGSAGAAMGELLSITTGYFSADARMRAQRDARIVAGGSTERAIAQANQLFAIQSASLQVGAFGDMTAAAKGFFDEKSKGYQALATVEKAARAVEFALSVRAIAQDAIETGSKVATSAARAAASGVEAIAKAIASLPFPANLVAGAATAAALVAAGVSVVGSFGGGGSVEPGNSGTGTTFGDADAQSQSIKRAIDGLKEIDTLMLTASRGMAASLRSIDSQIGGVAAVLVRGGDVGAGAGVDEGFKPNLLGSILGNIPLVGGFLSSLFGSSTKVNASGLFGKPQTLDSILGGGFNASIYSDIEKTSKFFGITTGRRQSTVFGGSAGDGVNDQFTLILREFNAAIAAAAGPLGVATDEVQRRLSGFVVDIGKIDLKDLTGEQIQEKLSAVFGAAGDRMAAAALPGLDRFQKVGEGAFETLVRVASTVEAVTDVLDRMGDAASALSIDAKIGIAGQFESVGAFGSAAEAYFERFYTTQEQAAARAGQFERVFAGLGIAMPGTLAAFRRLVEAQNLTTAAGQSTYATLLQLAPAFADLQWSMSGAKSAADILAERQDIERRILELQGDTAALRALDLARIDASNRALQLQMWAIEDAQAAARAADELRKAWGDIGSGIMDEVRRIRGLTGAETGAGFATLQGQFNAASTAAQGGDQDAAKLLPGISQALLRAAELAAASRQELDRVQAQTAASLEATFAAIGRFSAAPAPKSVDALIAAIATAPGGTAASGAPANDDLRAGFRALKDEIAAMRAENNAGHAATAGQAGRAGKVLERVSGVVGGDALASRAA